MKGILKSLIPLLFDYSRVLDINLVIADNMSSCISNPYDLGIDFLPAEVMKGDKTTGSLCVNYNKVNKVWP